MSTTVATDTRRLAPLAIAGVGAVAAVAGVALGPKAAAAGIAVFVGAVLLGLLQTHTTIWTWPNAMVLLVAVIWLIPIRLYRLPVDLPVGVEPYRALVLALIAALGIWAWTDRGRITAAGAARPLILLGSVAIVSQIVNYQALTASTGEETALKSLSYFIGFILVFLLVASVLTSIERVDTVVRALVAGAVIVAAFAVYEGRTDYNIFNHLDEWIPALDKQAREIVEFRGGRLRVHASAQHPIALGVALAMMVPFALYLSTRASTVLRSRLWVAAAGVVAMGAISTISRTTVVMLVVMVAVGLWLRGATVMRFWPLLIILPFVIHFLSPGALGGLYKSFKPNQGLVSELEGRPGQSGSGRFADLDPGLRLWEEEPIIGHGLGAVSTLPTAVGSPLEGAPLVFDNQYLNTLVSVGAVGLFAVLWLVWGTLFKLAKAARGVSARSDLIAACCVSVAGFSVSMIFFDAFAFVQASLIFFIVAAIGLRAEVFEDSSTAAAARVDKRIDIQVRRRISLWWPA